MQPSSFSATPFALIPLAFNHGNLSPEGFELSRFLFLGSLLLSPGGGSGGDGAAGGMDFSKVGEKFLSSVRSARSLGFLPSTSDRPEVIGVLQLLFRQIAISLRHLFCAVD